MTLTPRQAAGVAALTLMWGLNWPIMKFTLREMTPLWFRAATMLGGALVLLVVLAGRGVKMHWPREEWLPIAILALPNIIGWHFFSIIGLRELASGRAATLGFTMPVWTALLTLLVTRERLTARVVVATLAACAAVGLLASQELTALMGRPLGVLWMQLAALSWAAGTLMMRRTRTPMPTEAVTVWMMLLGSAFFWLLAPLFEPVPRPAAFSTGLWVALAWGVLVNFGVAQLIWFGMARTLPATASAFSLMAVPLVGTLGATVVVGESPQATDWLAAAAIVVAIAAVLLPGPRAATR
jgi:drug/metabolite transporter (DMT)-like permease